MAVSLKTVVVLGANGMLGSMIFKYLSLNKKIKIIGTTRKKRDKKYKFFDAQEFNTNPSKFKYITNADYIINTIGIIKPFCKDGNNEGILNAILVNAAFPYNLSKYLANKTRIINIATDCVFSGETGDYNEKSKFSPTDVYDKTKNLGEINSKNTLNIRCSIIGPQENHSENLMQWFLNLKPQSSINGFSDHLWNGVTTLQFAKLVEKIIIKNQFSILKKDNHVLHFTPNNTVSKFQLLKYLNSIFDKNLIINKTKSPSGKLNRSLTTLFPKLTTLSGKSNIEIEIIELRKFMKLHER